MSAVVTQDIEMRYVPGKEAELFYTIRGAETEAAAASALSAEAPAAYAGLPRQRREIDTLFFNEDNTEQNIHKASVYYGLKDPTDFTTSFDTTGATQHLTQSLTTVASYPVGAPNMQGAIGYDGERVNGVDIVIPTYAFSETHFKTLAAVNQSYRNTLALLTGGVNNAAFRGFAAGEVLFEGVSGQVVTIENDQRWQLTFHFNASPNRTDISIGGITGIVKAGWDYLWELYGDVVDEGRLVQQPIAAYVERLYPQVNFSSLNIGTT